MREGHEGMKRARVREHRGGAVGRRSGAPMTVTSAALQLAKPSIAPCSPDGPCQVYSVALHAGLLAGVRLVYCDQAQAYTTHWRERQARREVVVPQTQRVCIAHARAFCERYGLVLP